MVLTQGHCQPKLCRIPCPGISSNNPGPFHPSTAYKQRGLSPLEATGRLRVVIRHPWKSSQPRACRPHLHLSSFSLTLHSGGDRSPSAGRTQLKERRELVARSHPPGRGLPGPLPLPPTPLAPEALTLAGRCPGARRSLWLRQGSQRQRGSGALQSTPTARSQRQPPAPARSTRHTALPTSAAAGGGPRARPPPRPQRAVCRASGDWRAARGPAAALRRPAGGVLGPPGGGGGGGRAPGVPARPPEPRARSPGAPRGRPARADGGRTAAAAPRLPRLLAEGA